MGSIKYFGLFWTWAVLSASLVGFLIVVTSQWRPASDSCFFTQLLVEKILFFSLASWACFTYELFTFNRPWKLFPGLLFSKHHSFRISLHVYCPNLFFLDCTHLNSIDARNGSNIQEFLEKSLDFEFEVFCDRVKPDFLGKFLDFGCYELRYFFIEFVSICFGGSLLSCRVRIIWTVRLICLL